jgi:hypothetical protein
MQRCAPARKDIEALAGWEGVLVGREAGAFLIPFSSEKPCKQARNLLVVGRQRACFFYAINNCFTTIGYLGSFVYFSTMKQRQSTAKLLSTMALHCPARCNAAAGHAQGLPSWGEKLKKSLQPKVATRVEPQLNMNGFSIIH